MYCYILCKINHTSTFIKFNMPTSLTTLTIFTICIYDIGYVIRINIVVIHFLVKLNKINVHTITISVKKRLSFQCLCNFLTYLRVKTSDDYIFTMKKIAFYFQLFLLFNCFYMN